MGQAKDRPYLWLFIVLSITGFIADQASKYAVFALLYPEDHQSQVAQNVIPGTFALLTNWKWERDPGDLPLSFLRTIGGDRLPELNHGALFGIGNARDGSGGFNSTFLVISILAACFVAFWASRPAIAQDRFLSLALGLILGGTLGNLYDRAVFGGVRDFLHFYYGDHIWPDFNIADACLVCGAGILLVHSFFVKEPESPPAAPANATTEQIPADSTAQEVGRP